MSDPVERVREAIRNAAAQLGEAQARDEALADFQPARRVLLITRAATMVPRGRVWRLGVVLLTPEARLLGTGQVTRAVEPRWANNQAVSAEIRREYRAAAYSAKFVPGETVNFDTAEVSLDTDSLVAANGDPDAVLLLRDEEVLVRWSAVDRSAVMPFLSYLKERVQLLMVPPQGT